METIVRYFILNEKAGEYNEVDHHKFEQAEGVIDFQYDDYAYDCYSVITLTKVIGV